MAGLNYHRHPYIERLNSYHLRLQLVADLSAHLMDHADEDAGEEWHQSACTLMRDQLLEVANSLPFPPEDVMRLEEGCE
jgi:hypothetical protein